MICIYQGGIYAEKIRSIEQAGQPDWGFYGKTSYLQVSEQDKPDRTIRNYPRLIGCEAFVKHENHNPTGSFKIRGALNFFHHMSKEELETGILVATRGNHGLAMAWAGQWFHVPCTVVVPEGNNPEINRTIESYGAELIVHGEDFYDAQSYCEELVDSAGYYYVQQGNEPEILNGLATMGLEILEDLPEMDTIICPIGGGAGCASILKTARAFKP